MTVFSEFYAGLHPQSALRDRITKATRMSEERCVQALLEAATLPETMQEGITNLAYSLAQKLREKRKTVGVEALVQEFSLSSQEGVALMCLAEALLRIPDVATRDALIRDKIGRGDWVSYVGRKHSLFINASAWGLMMTGRVISAREGGSGYMESLNRVIRRGGEPVVRRAVNVAMRLMGEQFVIGQTIHEAIENSQALEEKGFRYSYDMLGEAAVTHADAERYRVDYERAIHAIGASRRGSSVYDRSGISIKLSALHPRYARAQRDRVMKELLPVVINLALLARRYDIGINIDAEESDRLEISLDIMEALCQEPGLKGWNGIGFVVQAYGRRAYYVLDYLIDLARRTEHRLMIRLVKGAYWDSEIKKAQVDGQSDFPVFTRKIHTDVSYIACARKLLDARDVVFPQFATHNARTVATVYRMAGVAFEEGSYEFQCLHGMGEALYSEVVGADKLARPCRIYAPVGTHETLLAYLVRRLLENGANSSFVNQIGHAEISIDTLIADPIAAARAISPTGKQHDQILSPRALFGKERQNSKGLDLADEDTLLALAEELKNSPAEWSVEPLIGGVAPHADKRGTKPVTNPADHHSPVGKAVSSTPEDVALAMELAAGAAPRWAATSPKDRAACLFKAADILESRYGALLGLLVREAGKSWRNAVAEIREAIDFLRYYSATVERDFDNATHIPLGPVVCISPWNFPLAIFLGQVAAALAAGNPVLAKPAEETPLIAGQAVAILHEAGVPKDVVQLVTGSGRVVGGLMVENPAVAAVMFTGSTEVARTLAAGLAGRRSPSGNIIPLVAETGGQNAMVVDSSALAEQVVLDVIESAFDSAGQRCSALRVLCIQEDCADRVVNMLRGAMAELKVGNPVALHTDVGPVITEGSRKRIAEHIANMRAKGCPVYSLPLPAECDNGTFIAPTIIEVPDIASIGGEVFGPVLHVLRYARDRLDAVIREINGTGYGLTFGIHTRIEETVAYVTEKVEVGNIYVNRNMIGAVVGVQPFGGCGLSGTGPKAGGPLAVRRLLASCPPLDSRKFIKTQIPRAAMEWVNWLEGRGDSFAERARSMAVHGLAYSKLELPGPVGETNTYMLFPRGPVLCIGHTLEGLLEQVTLALSCDNDALVLAPDELASWCASLPFSLLSRIERVSSISERKVSVILGEDGCSVFDEVRKELVHAPHMIVPAYARAMGYRPEFLLEERTVSVNTTASGGNASLMSLG